MIKAFIRYNSGQPVIGLRALRSDVNSSNVLKLLGKALTKGQPQSLGLTFNPRDVTLEVATNLKKVSHEEN
jgi:hypothetical protein